MRSAKANRISCRLDEKSEAMIASLFDLFLIFRFSNDFGKSNFAAWFRRLALAQFFNGEIVNFAHETDFFKSDIFVGLMDGIFFAAKFRTERATVFQGSCIRAAADGDRGCFRLRYGVVYAK